MKQGVKNITKVTSRCLIIAGVSLLLANCGEDQLADANFNKFLETGEMKMAGDKGGAGGTGGDMCTSRVNVDKVCSASGTTYVLESYGSTRVEAETAAMAACEIRRTEEQAVVRDLANVEKEKCEKDMDLDGIKDCDFWTSEQFGSCRLSFIHHEIDGGGNNTDTICSFDPGSDRGNCTELPADTYNKSEWYADARVNGQCINVSCKR